MTTTDSQSILWEQLDVRHITREARPNNLFYKQVFLTGKRVVPESWGYGANALMFCKVRFDDECSNGQMSFAITADIVRGRATLACGCLHDEVAELFPELKKFLKWHLCSTDGPMHYTANTIFHASDRDALYHKRKGEPTTYGLELRFAHFPLPWRNDGRTSQKFLKNIRERYAVKDDAGKPTLNVAWSVFAHDAAAGPAAVPHKKLNGTSDYAFADKWTLPNYVCEWHEAPFETEREARDFLSAVTHHAPRLELVPTGFSEGKERNLDAARRTALWPDATDEQLCAEPDVLKAALEERLPRLIRDFETDMLELGFEWREPQPVEVEASQ